MNPRRRALLKGSAAWGASTAAVATLPALLAQRARAAQAPLGAGTAGGYGPLRPVADASGREVLALPPGFDLVTLGVLGEPLVAGRGTHARNADGMAAFRGPAGTVRLIRNQEVRNRAGDFTNGVTGEAQTRYDESATGGTTTIDYDPKSRRAVREFFSLNGTIVNCSGGLAYDDAGWLSCEESVQGPLQGWGRKHGYTFLVPADADAARPARPIVAMGRFVKEAAVTDPLSGIVYQTEDAGSRSGFYRYLPEDVTNLAVGGTLQILKVAGRDAYDTREHQRVGAELRVEWITIGDPDPDLEGGAPGCFEQGVAKGAARFFRLEGVHRGPHGSVLFVSTSGGDAKTGQRTAAGFETGYGQLWQYSPDADGGVLKLVYESSGAARLDSPDNFCVTPRGGILFCEDDASGDRDRHALAPHLPDVNRLVGMSREGEPYTFAVNLLNRSEFAGACFSPDGEILFVNIFGDGTPGSGMTCAVTGPWRAGPL